MAKVLLINGSPRENGNTFTALSEVAKTLNEEGVETEIVSIGKQAQRQRRGISRVGESYENQFYPLKRRCQNSSGHSLPSI